MAKTMNSQFSLHESTTVRSQRSRGRGGKKTEETEEIIKEALALV